MIVSNPKVMLGKPIVAGTRVTVEAILEKLAAGMSVASILEAYPHLRSLDVTDVEEFSTMEHQ